MAHPDEPQRPLNEPAASRFGHDMIVAAIAGVGAFALLFAVYLAIVVPGKWLAGVSQKVWPASDLVLAGGTGAVHDGVLVVSAPDATGTTLVTLTTDIRSADFLGIQWDVKGLPDGAEVRLLWKTDVATRRTNLANGVVEAGGLRTFVLAHDPSWIGHITGLALAVRTPLVAPLSIERVVARPLGAFGILRDRVREWTAFEGFNGTSINTLTGGADAQDLPLPLFVATGVALAALLLIGLSRIAPRVYSLGAACTIAGLFVAGWFVVDARWAWNLAQQTRVTWTKYAGKTLDEKHLAAEDGELFAFVQKARALMPATPVRVFVAAGEHYFRGRAAYHLYPHNVQFEAFRDTVAPASWMKPGDWVFVYHRRGIQYDAARKLLRWDNGPPVSAELKLIEPPGAALFLIQ